jgi:hypothetical protein
MTDETEKTLDSRVGGLEKRVGDLEVTTAATSVDVLAAALEARAAATLGKQVHEAVFGQVEEAGGLRAKIDDVHGALFGSDATPGVRGKVDKMYQVFDTAENALRIIGKVGDAAVRISDVIEKRPKTTAVAAVGSAVSYGMLTTGKVPEWIMSAIKMLIA